MSIRDTNLSIYGHSTECYEMTDAAAKIVWKLARRHSWGSPVPAGQLIRLATGSEGHDEMGRVLEDVVLDLPFIAQSSDGIFIPNGQDAHVEAANWLRAQTDIDDLTIEATLSRLPPDWPDDN